MTWDKMLEGALPEAVGGMLVTLIVLSYERIRDSNQRKKDFDRSRLAALSELRRMRDRVETHRALLEGTVPFEIPVTSIEALIRISMNGIGRPEFEAGLAEVVSSCDGSNALVRKLQNEATGVGRGMDDFPETWADASEKLKARATTALEAIDALIRLVQKASYA